MKTTRSTYEHPHAAGEETGEAQHKMQSIQRNAVLVYSFLILGCACTLRVQRFATPWTVARQAPLSMGFSRQELWTGSPCHPPGDLPNPEIEPKCLKSPASCTGRQINHGYHLGSPQLQRVFPSNNQNLMAYCPLQEFYDLELVPRKAAPFLLGPLSSP